jgi:hypothetical protein
MKLFKMQSVYSVPVNENSGIKPKKFLKDKYLTTSVKELENLTESYQIKHRERKRLLINDFSDDEKNY